MAKKITSLLLVVLLLAGVMPMALAAEVTTEPWETTEATVPETQAETLPPEQEVPTDTVPEETAPTETLPEETAPKETVPEETVPPTEAEATEAVTEPTEDTEPTIPMEEPPLMEAPAIDDGMLRASTISNVTLFDQASPNYTTYLSKQLTIKYRPNGTDSSKTAYIKNLGWHFARINGVSYPNDPIYCIEPHKNYAASTSGNYVDTGVTTSGSGSTHGANVWYAMPSAYREAIALTLLYSDQRRDDSYTVTNTSMAKNPNVPLRIATQFLIYEITMGLRDADSFELKDSNGYTDGDIFYNAGVSQVSGFERHYNAIVDAVQAAKEIPSFTSTSRSAAPAITLIGEETVVTDTNGVLSNFRFTDGSGAEFYQSGNDLYITQVGSIPESTVFSCYRNLPSAENSTVSVYYGASSTYQTCVKLYSPSSGNLNAYFKLKAPALGSVSLTKTTEDGKNLSGWRFGIYSDSACNNLVSGPYTTNTSGGTASVSFYNKLNLGGVKLIKTTYTGENLSGWQIGLYTDSGCTSAMAGSPFTTGADGTVSVSGLKPGTYYAKEVPITDPFWQCDTSVKTVTVTPGQTASVTFSNTHLGKIEFEKTTNTGKNLGGWTFRVVSDVQGAIGDFTTDESGYAATGYLLPGRYDVFEIGNEDEYWISHISPHDVTVAGGKISVDKWTNLHVGNLSIVKTMEGDGPIEGWQFRVTDSDGNEVEGSPFTTDEAGLITDKLLPGTYTVEELIPEGSPYICKSENPQTVTVVEGTNAQVHFINALRVGKISIEKMDANGKPLAGAEFLLEWSQDGETWTPVHSTEKGGLEPGGCTSPNLADGKLTSGEDGLVTFDGLVYDLHYRLTETAAPDGYQLLTKAAFEGQLPEDDSTISLRVVNHPVFTLPRTGSNSLILMPMIAPLWVVAGVSFIMFAHKSHKTKEEL